jgi:hypothetical protein
MQCNCSAYVAKRERVAGWRAKQETLGQASAVGAREPLTLAARPRPGSPPRLARHRGRTARIPVVATGSKLARFN